jgi:FMN phosphatase YigB (HAD superfamily)
MNTVLFDLDGTLLPLREEEFIKIYFGELAKRFIKMGFDANLFIKAIWSGTEAMRKNDGKALNENVFWRVFNQIIQGDQKLLEEEIIDFYATDFDLAKTSTSENPVAKACIALLKEKGYTVVLATNPLFPWVATHKRATWAGLDPDDFELITTYENSAYCKPNLKYYEGILNTIHKLPEDCLMVGNDVKEDMCVSALGMDTFLLKDCLINLDDQELSPYRQGNFNDLFELIKSLPILKESEKE